jgi:hypothetical protein
MKFTRRLNVMLPPDVADAAPDLLEALLQAEIVTAEACQGQDMANECWRILGQIRAAIAKAEGLPTKAEKETTND